MAIILDGKKFSEKILKNLKEQIQKLDAKPLLSIILCGNNPSSLVYINAKKKKAEEVGINIEIHKFEENVNEIKVLNCIENLNKKSDAIIVQLPLPKKLNTFRIIKKILPEKDVDGLTPYNMGKTLLGDELLVPATPKGIIKLFEEYKIPLEGKNITIINHSNLLGKPLALMLLNRNATVTVCNKSTKDLSEKTKKADILITGVGTPEFVKGDMVKNNAVVIDAGISKKNNKIFGDVDFQAVKEKASYITPVPGGVGPMTVAMLLENVLLAYKLKKIKNEHT